MTSVPARRTGWLVRALGRSLLTKIHENVRTVEIQQPQRLRAALPRSPVQPWDRAQKLFFRALSLSVFGLGAGAFKLLPVAALYLARPFAVSPAPLETGSFSPRPTDRLGDFLDAAFLAMCKVKTEGGGRSSGKFRGTESSSTHLYSVQPRPGARSSPIPCIGGDS